MKKKRLVLSKETLRALAYPNGVVAGALSNVCTTNCRSRAYTNCGLCASVGGTCSDCLTCLACSPYSEFCTL
jgi:hypothetical protein